MAITNSVTSVITIIRGLIEDKSRIDGRDSFPPFSGDNVYTLSEDFPSASTITVFVNSVEIDSQDLSYNSDNNQVTIEFITSGISLNTDDNILITYNYFKKYSDIEIQGFLESSLVYFTQHQYKKTFEINDDNEIVAINALIPTTDELYVIATVASILIDPQNIRINIPDLSLTAKRDKSDQQQIMETIRNFQNFVGTIDFEIIRNLHD